MLPHLSIALIAASLQPAPGAAPEGGHVVQAPERWRLVPDLRYTDGPAASLTRVEALAAGPGGRLHVADRGRPGVLLFGADGRHLGTLGSEGEGPGEFRSVWSLGHHGDTLWIADARLNRVTFFGPEGGLLGTASVFRRLSLPSGVRRPLVHGAVSREAFFVLATRGERTSPEVVFLRVPAEGSPEEIGVLDLTDRWFVVTPPGQAPGTSSFHQPFGFYDQFALAPDGRRFVILRRGGARRGAGEYAVELHDARGRREATFRVPYEPRALTEAEVDRWLDGYLERGIVRAWLRVGMFPGRRAVREAARRALELRETAPPTANDGSGIRDGAILIGRGGRILIRRFRDPDREGRRWDVIDPGRGGRIAVLAVPEGVELRAADGGRVWGVTRDVYDVPSLWRYRVEHGGLRGRIGPSRGG